MNTNVKIVLGIATLGIATLGMYFINKKNTGNKPSPIKNKEAGIIKNELFSAEYKGRKIQPLNIIDERTNKVISDGLGLYNQADVYGVFLNNKFLLRGKVQGGNNVQFASPIRVSEGDLSNYKRTGSY